MTGRKDGQARERGGDESWQEGKMVRLEKEGETSLDRKERWSGGDLES